MSDSMIGLAYYTIPVAMLYFVRKRSDLQFSWIFVCFSIFIFACGTTHFLAVWTIWHPDYWVDALLKAVTAAVSIITAILLWPLVPKALQIPSMRQLNQALQDRERELAERKRVETALVALNESLELRVAERTAEVLAAQREVNELLVKERAGRKEAERVSLMKDEFLLTLSHELRTPLNSIFGWTQILDSNYEDAAIVRKGIEVIDRNVRLQTRLIDELLDLSSIASGKIRLEMQPVELATVIGAAVESIMPAAESKHIELEYVADPAAPLVSGDPARLQQVLWNLLTNAVKFTPRQGRISVLLEQAGSHMVLTIADTGEGIPEDFLPFVFERFSQADSSTRRRHGGLGVGLAVAKNLIELHGGHISVSSAGAGQGTTFCVSLPIRVRNEAEARAVRERAGSRTEAPAALPALDGLRVLVVDDEPDARGLLQQLLQQQRAQPVCAASVDAALAAVERGDPHVIICDIGMPGQDGYDFIAALRGRGDTRPVVALSAFARSEDRVRSLKAGFQAHLAKPVDPAELLSVVASLAGQYS
ncbi:hybrid sensor histidine kinase/response regulator [Duganella sp. FT3S]|uniref:Virulence sensor protein BvgS n=1 Tax=Rugamonas fusca TaxID=2758568 RepID=A0A7W2EHF0_9BURK|nr:hybrid sensor histidine kinase/response regulator [Rugamonas fusca]MBA5605978.1 hybrid sensor histidine kinase/response regulator [Rugamonas fusca]